jgi:hypothetical protein
VWDIRMNKLLQHYQGIKAILHTQATLLND